MKKLLLFLGLIPSISLAQTNDSDYQKKIELSSEKICNCLNEIDNNNKTSEEKNEAIKKCIEDEIRSSNLLNKLFTAYEETKENPSVKNVNITYNPEEKAYGSPFYYDVERYLMQNCKRMEFLMKSNDYIFPNSISNDEKALNYYQQGLDFFEKEDYIAAEKAYKSATETDPIFSSAWNNLGLTYRMLKKYDLALEAYKNSLLLDPNGIMPLQNIPIIYTFKEEYDNAINAYQNITKVYPKNAEAEYGIGCIYIYYKNDIPKGLDYLCKAYLKYIESNSPYRVDAEKVINYAFEALKKENKTDIFYKILQENDIQVKE